MGTETIHAKAPTRIDLAGGTLDLWPIYLFLKEPTTLNLGIDLFAEATLEIRSSTDPKVKLVSKDQGHEIEFPWKALSDGSLIPPPALELHFKLLRFFYEKKQEASPQVQMTLTTQAKSPAGAGLGGSSTLSIAMIGALATWANGSHNRIDPNQEGEALIEIVRDVETTVIQVPAGVQDYYGAMFGGLQSLKWGAGSHHREWLSEDLLPELDQRLLLFYSGQSRNSGINNWTLFKSFIDRQSDIRARFEKISEATRKLEKALLQKNWTDVGSAIAEEWAVRKTLASGITTPDIDSAFQEASKLAPVAGKVCGAGGGGCFFVYLPDPSKDPQIKSRIVQIFSERNIRNLPFRSVKRGLEVHVTRT